MAAFRSRLSFALLSRASSSSSAPFSTPTNTMMMMMMTMQTQRFSIIGRSLLSVQTLRFSTQASNLNGHIGTSSQTSHQGLSEPGDYEDLNLQDLLRREEFISVRRQLEADPREQMPLDEYVSVCDAVGISKQDAIRLSQSLTDAGVIFFNPLAKDPLLSHTIFLKPQKISNLIHAAFSEQKLFTGAGTVEEYNKLKAEFESMSALKQKIDKRAHNYATFWILAAGGYMIAQAAVLARLTWWEFSWDIMEPITYFITFSTGIVGWMYFAATKAEYTYENLRDGIARRRREKLYKRLNFNIERYHELESLFQKPSLVKRVENRA